MAHQITLLLGVEHHLGLGQQSAVHPRRHCGAKIDLDLHVDRVALAGQTTGELLIDGGRARCPVVAQPEQTERLDELERDRPRPQDPSPTVVAAGVVDVAGAEPADDPPSGEGHVQVDLMGVPLVGRRLDADPRQGDVAVVPDPCVHRLPQVGIVGLGGVDELQILVETPRQVDCHGHIPRSPAQRR